MGTIIYNKLNDLIKKIKVEDEGKTLRKYITESFQNISDRLISYEESYNTIISDSGNSNREIVDARVYGSGGISYETLKLRLDAMQNKIDTMYTKSDIVDLIFPIGFVVTLETSIDPNSIWGGKWIRTAKGKFIVGLNENETEFRTLGRTGGEKTNELTVDEMPRHDHEQLVTVNNGGSINGRVDYNTDAKNNNKYTQGIRTGLTGGGNAHNNLPPYEVAYKWKRIA